MTSSNETPSPIHANTVYETLWRGRDLEISTQWQRSVLLGTFLVLSFAGYGQLMLREDIGVCLVKSSLIHWQALGIALFGMFFSFLWVYMAKASKAWVEFHEDVIDKFGKMIVANFSKDSPCEGSNAKAKQQLNHFVGFNHWDVFNIYKKPRRSRDLSPFSFAAGACSPSRINILIGLASFVIWVILAVVHVLCLDPAMRASLVQTAQSEEAVCFGVLLVGFMLLTLFLIVSSAIKSSTLQEAPGITENVE